MKQLSLVLLLAVSAVFAQSASAQKFALPKLPYAYNALEPYIDAQTMEIHHSKHHQAYTNNLNKVWAEKEYGDFDLEELMLQAPRRGDAFRNNSGGFYNHSLFWEILAPNASQTLTPAFEAAVKAQYTSVDSLKKLLTQAASSRFGSGWAWLIVTVDGKLAVTSTANQDNPIMDVAEVRGVPILAIDVWEHAYYLKYQNKRADYLGAIWKVLDWSVVSSKYAAALGSPLLKMIEKDGWKELNAYHKMMASTFHPAEDGDFKPIKERSKEFVEAARLLNMSIIPKSFNTPEVKKTLADILKGTEEVHKLVTKKAKDAAILERLTKLHDTFHIVQGLCKH